MSTGPVGALITFVVFGTAGLMFSRNVTLPVAARTWLLLITVAVCCSFIGKNTALVSVHGVGIVLMVVLVSFLLGTLAGLWFRNSHVAA
jgi:hypothetical protein